MGNAYKGANQWKVKSCNFITGCSHDCLYCFSKASAVYRKSKTRESWKEETINRKQLRKKQQRVLNGRIMFPSTHDISPTHLKESIQFIRNILVAGNEILIVSKPHLKCIEEICNEFLDYKEKILFRFTIGSTNDETLRFWEPGAPSFDERMSSLRYAYDAGYATSISCEPMLDIKIGDVISIVRPYVTHSIWLGTMNNMEWRLPTNNDLTQELKDRANQLYAWQSDEEIKALYERFKNDSLIRWKNEIKMIVGLPIGESGSDE